VEAVEASWISSRHFPEAELILTTENEESTFLLQLDCDLFYELRAFTPVMSFGYHPLPSLARKRWSFLMYNGAAATKLG
jgi:hypothetical protein